MRRMHATVAHWEFGDMLCLEEEAVQAMEKTTVCRKTLQNRC